MEESWIGIEPHDTTAHLIERVSTHLLMAKRDGPTECADDVPDTRPNRLHYARSGWLLPRPSSLPPPTSAHSLIT